jgi:hypothetical protein
MGKKHAHNEGIALLTATIFISIALVLLAALMARMMGERRDVDFAVDYDKTFMGIEAGLAQSRVELTGGGSGFVGLDGWQPTETSGSSIVLPTFDTSGVTPVHLASMPEVEYFALAQGWANDGLDNNGDGTIDGIDEQGYFTQWAFARCGNFTRSVEVVLGGLNISPWNNAVFAGSGATGGAIQGNCSLHGSVHILGSQIPEGAEAIVVLDMMGASLVHNNYGTGAGPGPVLSARLRASVPALPRTTFNGENVETINSHFRVKRGLVSLNSASEIGEPLNPGSGIKTAVDGTHNTDGWIGQRIDADGNPTNVYSDNGFNEGYDLGDRVSMPLLSDDWRWPEGVQCEDLGYPFAGQPGDTETSPDGDNYTHEEFFSTLVDGTPFNGDVTIKTGTAFYLNLSRPSDTNVAHRVKPDPATCTKGDDYIYYNPANAVLEINGQVEINGNLNFTCGTGSSGKIFYYTGRSALLVHGNVSVGASLVPCNNGVPGDYVNSFPARNCLGVMASGNMYTGVGSQRDVVGAFYAQGEITSNKQTVLMGTFVSNLINMGQQVPDVYQVPELTTHLPLGMVGNYPLLTYGQISWREL